jgi:transposase-like protein
MRAKAQLGHELVKSLSFKRHRFPADVIVHAVWLYFRFTLSFRDVEEMLVGGKRMYLWRAVDDEGEVLDLVMQRDGPRTAAP